MIDEMAFCGSPAKTCVESLSLMAMDWQTSLTFAV
jgi:hypothetical protein